MHRWKVGDEVWARYYSIALSNYEAKLEGRITAVGRVGFTMHRERPDWQGNVVERHPHDATFWPTREAAEEYIREHPFNNGRVETK